jgi:hypothetical protein
MIKPTKFRVAGHFVRLAKLLSANMKQEVDFQNLGVGAAWQAEQEPVADCYK